MSSFFEKINNVDGNADSIQTNFESHQPLDDAKNYDVTSFLNLIGQDNNAQLTPPVAYSGPTPGTTIPIPDDESGPSNGENSSTTTTTTTTTTVPEGPPTNTTVGDTDNDSTGNSGTRDGSILTRDRRNDDRVDFEIGRDDRWRRDASPDVGHNHWDSDWAGRAILGRYLDGGGDWVIVNEARWTEYMQASPLLTNDLLSRSVDTAQTLYESDNTELTIDEEYYAALDNGEGIVGHQYLHGTNPAVGNFERDGNATIEHHADGSATVTLEMEYTWNDIIDPNSDYATDVVKNGVAELFTLGQADPYDIHITWNETTIVELDNDGNVVEIRND